MTLGGNKMILGLNPYLIFDGNGEEAFRFYEVALDATVVSFQTYGDLHENPEAPFPDEVKKRIVHAHLKVGNTDLMLSETFPGQPYPIGTQVQIALNVSSAEKSKEVFSKLQESGQ
jgi:PhnB protein